MRMAVVWLVAMLAVAGGCQDTTAGSKWAATLPGGKKAATRPAEAAYTHEGAVKLYREAKYSQAEAMCQRGIVAIERKQGEKAAALAEPLDDLSTVYLRLAKYDAAKPLLERAESVLDKEKPADAIMLGRLAINKGWRMYALGDTRGAEKVFIQGRELLQKNQKEDTVELAELINNIGLAYDDADDPDEMPNAKRVAMGRTLLLRSWEMRKKLAGDESPECQESLNNLGMNLLFHGEGENAPETAINTLKKSLEMSEKVYGKDHPETAMARVNLALGLKLTEEDAAAEEQIKMALPITEKFLGKDHPDRGYELQVLGQIEQNRGNYKEAEADFQEAVRINEVTYGENHVNVASPLGDLRDLYMEMNQEAKAKAVQTRIDKLRGKEI